MKTFDAFHLPQLGEDIREWASRDVVIADGTSITLRWPKLSPRDAAHVSEQLRVANEKLKSKTTSSVVDAIDRAAASLRADREQWDRLCDLVSAVTRYSPAMTRHVMDRMADDWDRTSIERMISAELGSSDVLDGFVARGNGITHATGPVLSFHIFSGNVPGVAVTSIIRALVTRASVFGKPASGEPILAAAFAKAIAQVDRDIGNAIAICYWEGGSADIETEIFERTDAVVHYGGRTAIDDVRRRIPAHTLFLDHGPRISFGIVTRDALAADAASLARLADDIARAASTFDQQGCVSPHVVYVEDGAAITPSDFTREIASAFGRIRTALPPAALTTEDAAAIRQTRDDAEFRSIAGEDVELHAPDDLAYTVVFDAVPAFRATCLNRTLVVHPVRDSGDVASLITPYRDMLQSAAVAAPTDRFNSIALHLAGCGVSRITTFERLPWPPPEWHHDGRGPLTELLRFTDIS